MKIIVAEKYMIIADNVCSVEIYNEKNVCIFMSSQEEFIVEFLLKSNAEKCYEMLKEFFANI